MGGFSINSDSAWLQSKPTTQNPTGNAFSAAGKALGEIGNLFMGNAATKSQTSPIRGNQTISNTNAANNQKTIPTSKSSASEANIVAQTPADGDFKTGSVANNLFNKMMNAEDVKISVISDEISALMSKKNPTPEEIKQIQTH